MNNNIYRKFFWTAWLAGLIIVACTPVLVSPSKTGGSASLGSLAVSFGRSRTVLLGGLVAANVTVTLTKGSQTKTETAPFNSGAASLNFNSLEPGLWTAAAEARLSTGEVIARGSATLTINPGPNNLSLPLTYDFGSGSGILSLKITFPSGSFASLEASLAKYNGSTWSTDGVAQPGLLPVSPGATEVTISQAGLAAAAYQLSLVFKDGSGQPVKRFGSTVNIFGGKTSDKWVKDHEGTAILADSLDLAVSDFVSTNTAPASITVSWPGYTIDPLDNSPYTLNAMDEPADYITLTVTQGLPGQALQYRLDGGSWAYLSSGRPQPLWLSLAALNHTIELKVTAPNRQSNTTYTLNTKKGPAVGVVKYEAGTPIGVVFWVGTGSDVGKYKIVALKDVGNLKWGVNGNITENTANGLANLIAYKALSGANLADNKNSHAMAACAYWDPLANAVSTGNTETGWYLPALDEIYDIYTKKAELGASAARVGGSSLRDIDYYWSSSQSADTGLSRDQYFLNGNQGNSHRSNTNYVRAIRTCGKVSGSALPLTAPKTGYNPQPSFDAIEYTGAVIWKDGSNNTLAAGSTFAPETAYTATVVLTTKPGYTFNGLANSFFTVGGGTVSSQTHTADKSNFTISFPATGAADYTSTNIGTLKLVPAGKFQRDSGPANISIITRPYRMSATEITREQWLKVFTTDPSNTSQSTGLTDPVQQISWYRAIAFCNKLSIMESLQPVYSVKVSGTEVVWANLAFADIPIGNSGNNSDWDAATQDLNKNGYRLPTEMEWMWAAMGANKTATDMDANGVNTKGYLKAFAGSTGSNAIGEYAVYGYHDDPKNAGQTLTARSNPVGGKTANELGLFDMSGNVWEWCWDWHEGTGDNETVFDIIGTKIDYLGPDTGDTRIERGGSWPDSNRFFTMGFRIRNAYQSDNTGFRVVRP